MDKKAVTKWVKALRSGRYKQTTGALCEGEAHCCLGVAIRVNARGQERDNLSSDWFNASGTLSLEGKHLFGLSEEQHDNLIHLNDDERYSFEDIADYLETHVYKGRL